MGGIAAYIGLDRRPVMQSDVQPMVAVVPHRSRFGVQPQEAKDASMAAFGYGRPTAGLPALNRDEDDTVLIVADARIDNRHEVIDALRDANPGGLDTATDADLILAAYNHWGVEAAPHLTGDFAFVIWDGARRRAYAARDPMALRPLYYRVESGHRVLMASEAKQILAVAGVPRRINENAVAHHYLSRFDPLQWSFFEGIEVLAPGCSIVVTESGVRTWRHWAFDPDREIQYSSESDYIEHFRELLMDAVAKRFTPGPEVGVLLSGGIDSGTVAGVAGWLRARDQQAVPAVHAYTWNFGDLTQCDERHISRQLVQHFGFAETEVHVANLGPLAEYPDHGPDPDTPFLGSFQPTFERALATAAADGCGMVMSGDRGDLVNGAMIISYPQLVRQREWRQLGTELRRHRRSTTEPMRTILLGHLVLPALRRLRRRLPGVPQSRPGAYPPWLQEGFAERTGVAQGLGRVDVGGSAIDDYYREERRRLILDPMHMRGAIWTERTHARFGLGFADPWSDRRLAEFVVAIPQQIVNRPGRNDKQFVRQAVSGILPDSFLAAAKKTLPTPLYRRGLFEEGAATVRSLFHNSRSAGLGFINDERTLAAFERARRGEDVHFPIWRTICVEMWLRAHWDEM